MASLYGYFLETVLIVTKKHHYRGIEEPGKFKLNDISIYWWNGGENENYWNTEKLTQLLVCFLKKVICQILPKY